MQSKLKGKRRFKEGWSFLKSVLFAPVFLTAPISFSEQETKAQTFAVPSISGEADCLRDKIDYILTDNRDCMKSLIQQNGVNVKDEVFGETLLHWAVKWGSQAMMEFLIEQGADVNAVNKKGATPLFIASFHGDREAMSLLIEEGADVNAGKEGNLNSTPLHWAAFNGHTESVKLLLAGGADADIENNLGLTPLDFALMRDRFDIARLLADDFLDKTRVWMNKTF